MRGFLLATAMALAAAQAAHAQAPVPRGGDGPEAARIVQLEQSVAALKAEIASMKSEIAKGVLSDIAQNEQMKTMGQALGAVQKTADHADAKVLDTERTLIKFQNAYAVHQHGYGGNNPLMRQVKVVVNSHVSGDDTDTINNVLVAPYTPRNTTGPMTPSESYEAQYCSADPTQLYCRRKACVEGKPGAQFCDVPLG